MLLVHENDLCEDCDVKEMTERAMYYCKIYSEDRKELIAYLNKKGKNNDVGYLLG